MATTLQTFLAKIACDPDLLTEYIKDPDRVMREAELPSEDRAALKSGSTEDVIARLGAGAPCAACPKVQPISRGRHRCTTPSHTHFSHRTRRCTTPSHTPSSPSGTQGAPRRQGLRCIPAHRQSACRLSL